MTWKRKERLPEKERVEKAIRETEQALVKDDNGQPIAGPFYSARRHRRGQGTPRDRIFSEKMAIPRKR